MLCNYIYSMPLHVWHLCHRWQHLFWWYSDLQPVQDWLWEEQWCVCPWVFCCFLLFSAVLLLFNAILLALIYFCCFINLQSHRIVDYICASHCYILHLVECPTNCNTCADRAGTMTCTVCNTGYALDSNSACVSEYFLNQYYIFIYKNLYFWIRAVLSPTSSWERKH